MPSTPESAASPDANPGIAQRVLQALVGLDYGTVEIVIHDRKVVQIDRRQKTRFAPPLEVPTP